jgi:hypothetical protein
MCEKRNINIYNTALSNAIERSSLKVEIYRIDFKNEKETLELLISLPSSGRGTLVTDELILEEADFNSIFKLFKKKKNMLVSKISKYK